MIVLSVLHSRDAFWCFVVFVLTFILLYLMHFENVHYYNKCNMDAVRWGSRYLESW